MQSLLGLNCDMREFMTEYRTVNSSSYITITVPDDENWLITHMGSSLYAGALPDVYHNGYFRVNGIDYISFPRIGALADIKLFLKGGSNFGFYNAHSSSQQYFVYSGFKL